MRHLKFIWAQFTKPAGGRPARAKIFAVTVPAAILAAATSLAVSSPASASAPAVTFTGSFARMPAGSGTMTIEAEVPSHLNRQDVPAQFTDIPVATARVGAGAFSVSVPSSATLTRAEKVGNGWVNFVLLVNSGNRATSQYVPAGLSSRAALGNKVTAAEVAHHTVAVPAFRAFSAMTTSLRHAIKAAREVPDAPIPCGWVANGAPVEDPTRIGEVHVDQDSGSTDTFKYVVQADSSISVGISATDGNFGADGSAQVSNTFSGSGSFNNGAGTLIYANADFYYQKYSNNGSVACGTARYKVQAASAVGDAFQGIHAPPSNPYGSCHANDPNGYAQASSGGGTFDSDRGRASSYTGIATVFGFSFGGTTGFSNDIYQDYTNNSSKTQYYCGASTMPDVAVIYNADN
jgi:hypothetical protein